MKDKVYEQNLGNVTIRAPRKKKKLELGINPVAAEIDKRKIDESKMPAMELGVTTPDVIVEGKDKRKPLDIGLSRVDAEIDSRKIDESRMPELELGVTAPDVVVEAKDKRKPLDIGVKPTSVDIDKRKIDEDRYPLIVPAPKRTRPLEVAGGKPVAAEIDKSKIDESRMPEMELGVTLPDINVEGENKRKPLDIGISPVESTIDKRKAREIPTYIEKPKPIGGYEDPYKDAYAQPVKPSNEIDYSRSSAAQSAASKVIKDYQDAELAGVINSPRLEQQNIVPAEHEDVEIINPYDEEEEEIVNPEKDKTEAQRMKEMTELWYPKDTEDDAKRKKAAQWITAAQMLGDSIGALSNVYWTGKGANSQKVTAGAPMAAETAYKVEKDIREAREKAAKEKLDYLQKEYDRKFREKQAEKQQANADRAYELQKSQLAETVANRAQQQANWSAQQATANEQWNKTHELAKQREARLASENEEKKKPKKFTVDGETIEIEDFDSDKLSRIYNSLPDDIKNEIEKESVYGGIDGKTVVGSKPRKYTDEDMLRAIYKNVGNSDVANAIRKVAGLKPVEPSKEGVVDTKEKKEEGVKDNIPMQGYDAGAAQEWGANWRKRVGLQGTDFNQYKR